MRLFLFLFGLACGNRSLELTASRRDVIYRSDGGSAFRLAVSAGFLYENQRLIRASLDIALQEIKIYVR